MKIVPENKMRYTLIIFMLLFSQYMIAGQLKDFNSYYYVQYPDDSLGNKIQCQLDSIYFDTESNTSYCNFSVMKDYFLGKMDNNGVIQRIPGKSVIKIVVENIKVMQIEMPIFYLKKCEPFNYSQLLFSPNEIKVTNDQGIEFFGILEIENAEKLPILTRFIFNRQKNSGINKGGK